MERVVNSLRVIAPEIPFPIEFIELEERCQTIETRGYIITAYRVNHNVTCYAYTIEIKRAGKFSADNARALNIPLMYWNRLQKGETIQDGDVTYTPDMVLGPERKGIKVSYATDTRPVDAIAEHSKGADLFICEGMYGEKEKEEKARAYKHMTMYEAARLANKAEVGQMWLTHYSPSLTYPENYMDAVRKIFKNSIAAKDGRTIDIDFID